MDEAAGRQLANKWVKTAALLSHPRIAPHIPPSRIYTQSALRTMLAKYGMVVIKPLRGAGGHGVIKVTQSDGKFSYSYYTTRRSFSRFEALVKALSGIQRGRRYLIQKGIHLASINGRPIDYRVKYVYEDGSRWVIRSMVGRLAKPGLFVTNLCRGGELLTSNEGIRKSLSPRMVTPMKRKMRQLTQISTELLQSRYPGIGQLGFDYGIDKYGKIWIFEVNTRPQ